VAQALALEQEPVAQVQELVPVERALVAQVQAARELVRVEQVVQVQAPALALVEQEQVAQVPAPEQAQALVREQVAQVPVQVVQAVVPAAGNKPVECSQQQIFPARIFAAVLYSTCICSTG
jgi:hypothetical protein